VLGKSYGSLVYHERKRGCEFTGGANGGRRRMALAREERKTGGFYSPVACRGGYSVDSWPTVATAWRGGGWRRAAHRRQWRMAVRPSACARRPRVTGLGLHARVTGPSCIVAAARASDSWSLRCLGVRARPGYGEPTWWACGDVVRGCAGLRKQLDLAHLKMDFLQNFTQ
jgi:hypothetical protein